MVRRKLSRLYFQITHSNVFIFLTFIMNSIFQKFLDAQEHTYDQALTEIKSGRKSGHWMWYIFPQVAGLGQSPNSVYYAISDYKEAIEYLQHPVLSKRLYEICEVLYSLPGTSAEDIFGKTDAMKLRSCVTLFGLADHSDDNVFIRF